MSYLQFFILSVSDNRFLFSLCIFLQCKNHFRIPFKKARLLLPACPTFTVLQANKLLFHFSSTVRTYFIAFSHRLCISLLIIVYIRQCIVIIFLCHSLLDRTIYNIHVKWRDISYFKIVRKIYKSLFCHYLSN